MKTVLVLFLFFGFGASATVMTCSKSPIEYQPAQVDIRGNTAIYQGLRWTISHRSNVMRLRANNHQRYFLIKLYRADVFWGPGFSCFIDPIE